MKTWARVLRSNTAEDLPHDPELRAMMKPPALSKKYKIPVQTPEPTATFKVAKSDGMPPLPLRMLKKAPAARMYTGCK